MRKVLGDDPDFSDESCLEKAEQLVNQMIRKSLVPSSRKKKSSRKKSSSVEEGKLDAIVQSILTDILYAIYYLVALPEVGGTSLGREETQAEEESSDSSSCSSEEENPNAVISPFLAAAKAGKSSRKQKKRRRVEPVYCYFVGNKDSLVVRWLDMFFRHIFRNELDAGYLFTAVQEAAAQLDVFDTEKEVDARERICAMFGPDSRLPTWHKYLGTVIKFMLHLFPIHQELREFRILPNGRSEPTPENPLIRFDV
jgi:hypothetical protein